MGLRVRTPRLELRLGDDEDLLALAALSHEIHGPDERPFAVGWNLGITDVERERRVLQYHWAQRGLIAPEAWRLELVTVVDGQVVGTQGVLATAFPVSRTVATGSWLGRAHQGQGIGSEMRAAVLHLAFAGLGALRAETGAFATSAASLAVTAKQGYRPNGDHVWVEGDLRRVEQTFALEREAWEPTRRDDIELLGVEACLPLLGLGSAEGDAIG